jgi:hypothetical protein
LRPIGPTQPIASRPERRWIGVKTKDYLRLTLGDAGRKDVAEGADQ